ncbi:MAG: hypothetical protein KOO61_09105, partial [Spirochaetales bacterium]|nr:hypothetical protein [Spirochaetales bacterium]
MIDEDRLDTMKTYDSHGNTVTPSLFTRFLSLGTCPDASAEARRRGELVNGLCTIAVVFLAALGTVAALRGVTALAIADFATALVLVALLAFFWATGRYNAVAHIGVAFIGIVFVYLLMSGGEDQTAYVWYYAFPLMSTFLLGARKGSLASATLLALASLYFLVGPQAEGWAAYSTAFEIRFVSSFALVSLASFIYERMRSAASQALARQTQTLQDTVANLTEAQTNLSATNERLRTEIRQRKEAVFEMQAATAEAHRANQAKSQFLANMSHELRTPLNHVIGFSEIVLSEKVGELNETQQEYLGDVLSSSRHLLAIINDVLDLARVEAGKADLEYSEVDLPSLLRDSIRIVEDQAERKGVHVQVDADSVPASVTIDERMIRQVLYN